MIVSLYQAASVMSPNAPWQTVALKTASGGQGITGECRHFEAVLRRHMAAQQTVIRSCHDFIVRSCML